jgi:Domain of unknown function (DUF5753)
MERVIGAAERPNIDLRILPYPAGLYPAVGNPFVFLTVEETVDPDVALCESRVDERYFHDADEVAGFHADFRQIKTLRACRRSPSSASPPCLPHSPLPHLMPT